MELSSLKAALNRVCIRGSICNIEAAGQRGRQGCIQCDSRLVRAGDIFVAVRGVHADGHDYITQAVEQGAGIIVAEREVILPEGVELVLVEDSTRALGRLAQMAQGEPAAQMKVLGVTGTNGKTTVGYLTRAMLQAAGLGCGLIGTVEYDVGDGSVIKAENTTPGPPQLAQLMAQMRENGMCAVVMECSSHGLDQQRTAGINFTAAAFTNLSGDHLDYHANEQEYLKAKSKLFTDLDQQAVAVLNAQDRASEYIAKISPAQIWWYGIETESQIGGRIQAKGLWGCDFELRIFDNRIEIKTALIGEHNVSNCLAAAALAWTAGASMEAIAEGISNLPNVPGRLEQVGTTTDEATVIVDYAHTDDALKHSLTAVRELAEGEVIVVFGCGGNRDRSKRPRMAKAAERLADRIVVTSDNPRQENPLAIIAEIRQGFSPAGLRKVTEIPDRREAIAFALRQSRASDVVLIAGKGHEDYQIIGEQKRPFDDRQVVREVWAQQVKI